MEAIFKEKQEALEKLEARLLSIDLEQQNGAHFYCVEELEAALKKIVDND